MTRDEASKASPGRAARPAGLVGAVTGDRLYFWDAGSAPLAEWLRKGHFATFYLRPREPMLLSEVQRARTVLAAGLMGRRDLGMLLQAQAMREGVR